MKVITEALFVLMNWVDHRLTQYFSVNLNMQYHSLDTSAYSMFFHVTLGDYPTALNLCSPARLEAVHTFRNGNSLPARVICAPI